MTCGLASNLLEILVTVLPSTISASSAGWDVLVTSTAVLAFLVLSMSADIAADFLIPK